MDSSDERLESLTRNIEEYERRARRRVWISFSVPLFFGLLFLGYTLWQIQVYGEKLAGVQVELTKQTSDLNAAEGTLQAIQGDLNQSNETLDELQVTSTAVANDLRSSQDNLLQLADQLTQTTDELQRRSDFLAYSIEIDSSAIKEALFEYPSEAQVDLLNYILALQERRIPYDGNGFSEREGFNSPNFTVYVMQQCGLVSDDYGANSGPQSMLSVINQDELSIGDIVFDELGSGYSMFYFELGGGEKFLIGMTPAGILAVEPEFILTPKYFKVPYKPSGASQCPRGVPKS